MVDHPSLIPPKKTEHITEEAEKVALELIEKCKPIAENRRKIQEQTNDLQTLIASISAINDKLENLNALKAENAQLEREVLTKINRKLGES